MASYSNFGLKLCKKIGGIISKVDVDQIYIENVFEKQLSSLEHEKIEDKNIHTYLWGLNTFVSSNQLLISKKFPFNGGNDFFLVTANTLLEFEQTYFYEILKFDNLTTNLPPNNTPGWFHFMKRFVGVKNFEKNEGFNYSIENYIKEYSKDIFLLNDDLVDLFEQNIRPILKKAESPYANILLD